jgi:hypothetical protein
MQTMTSDYYFISAGEPSGDLLAAELVAEMKKRFPELTACGIAGPKMIAEDVHALAHIDDLSVMGFVEVIKHLPKLKRLDDFLLETIDRHPPRFAILVDYPGFHMRFAAALKRAFMPTGTNTGMRRSTPLNGPCPPIVPMALQFFTKNDVKHSNRTLRMRLGMGR